MAEITKARASKCTTHHRCDCATFRLQEMAIALRIIQTWASVPGALDPEQVRNLCKEALFGAAAALDGGGRSERDAQCRASRR